MNVGYRMRQRRKELRMNAEHVAEKIGVSRSTIFRYENGDIEKVPTHILESLAEILETTPEFLMGWDDSSDDIVAIYSKLTKENKNKVYDFARYQLQRQNETGMTLDFE